MKPLSLRGRLTAWYAGTLVVVLIVAAAVVVWQQERIATRRLEGELMALGETVGNVLQDEIRESTPQPASEAITTLGLKNRAVAIVRNGTLLAAAWNGLMPPRANDLVSPSRPTWIAPGTDPGSSWLVHREAVHIDGGSYVVMTAAPLADIDRERHQLEEAMAIGIPLVVLLAAAGGWWLAAIGLRPIAKMAERAAQIGPAGMADLGPSARDDELGTLTRAFNDLVGRLRTALRTQRQFMADASHELRTPVSVIKTAADVMLARDSRPESEYREALAIVDAEARRVTRLVEDMLVLARADAGGYPLQRSRLYVDDLIADCTRAIAVLARDRGVEIDAPARTDTVLDGDEHLLRRMLVNVVQNAVQHAVSGHRVVIDVVPNGSSVAIDVTNDGHPIAETDRERIFDRFVQLDAARRASGSGLGLPIARWIAEAHGGTLTLKRSGPEATTFSIMLPV